MQKQDRYPDGTWTPLPAGRAKRYVYETAVRKVTLGEREKCTWHLAHAPTDRRRSECNFFLMHACRAGREGDRKIPTTRETPFNWNFSVQIIIMERGDLVRPLAALIVCPRNLIFFLHIIKSSTTYRNAEVKGIEATLNK